MKCCLLSNPSKGFVNKNNEKILEKRSEKNLIREKM